MKKILLFSCLIFAVSSLYSQSDTLNKFDSNGKKHGYWMQYLDSLTSPTDRVNARFYGYELYNHGAKSFHFVKHKISPKKKITCSMMLQAEGSPVVLDGIVKEFKKFHGKMLLNYELTFIKGHIVCLKQFIVNKQAKNTVNLRVMADFTKKYKNTFGTYYEEVYHKRLGKTETRKYWFREKDGHWMFCFAD